MLLLLYLEQLLNKNNKSNSEDTEVNNKSQVVNDPTRTLFLQNVNYSASEAELKAFFSRYGNVVYAKICRTNGVSKGTAFVMFSDAQECEEILSIYKKCENSENNQNNELNPFEFNIGIILLPI